jgi:hypothetical protein
VVETARKHKTIDAGAIVDSQQCHRYHRDDGAVVHRSSEICCHAHGIHPFSAVKFHWPFFIPYDTVVPPDIITFVRVDHATNPKRINVTPSTE